MQVIIPQTTIDAENIICEDGMLLDRRIYLVKQDLQEAIGEISIIRQRLEQDYKDGEQDVNIGDLENVEGLICSALDNLEKL